MDDYGYCISYLEDTFIKFNYKNKNNYNETIFRKKSGLLVIRKLLQFA